MNFGNFFVDQVLGSFKYSSDIVSNGSDKQLVPYKRSKISSCSGNIGKNGKNDDATMIERILPKLEDKVILMYFMVLPKDFSTNSYSFSRTFKSLWSRIISADSLAISTAVSTEIDTSAAFMAGASLIPSPI